MSESSSEEWEDCDDPEEAIEIFYDTLFGFAEVMVHLCTEEETIHPKKYAGKVKPSTKIIVVKGLLELFTKERLMQHYVNYVLTWKKKIDDRDDKFFLENDHIYPNAPESEIEFFRDLWRPNSTFHLSDVEKESVYEYFDIMLHYCEVWKNLSGYTAFWDLVPIVEKYDETKAYDYIMENYNIEEFDDFGYGPYDEFLAKYMPDSHNES